MTINFASTGFVDPFFLSFGMPITVYLSTSTAAGKDIMAILDASESPSLQSPNPPGANMVISVCATDVPKPNYRDRFVVKNSSGEDEDWYPTNNMTGGHRTGIFEIELTHSTRRRA